MSTFKIWQVLVLALLIGGVAMAEDHHEHEHDDDDHYEERLPDREIIEFLKTHDLGYMAEELKEVREEEPEEYGEMLEEISHHIREYRELKEHAPELADAMLKSEQLEHKSWLIAEHIGESESTEEKAQLKKELHTVLSKLFELRLLEGAYELRELEEEIQDIRASIERRKKNREKIIERRMNMMLDETDEDLHW